MNLNIISRTNIESVLKKTSISFFDSENQKKELNDLLGNLKIEKSNNFIFNLLEQKKIYHISQIKKVCIDYRLRFLDVKYFKNQLPNSAIEDVLKIEKEHKTSINGFKIIAPSALFRLKKTDDPLLFAPLGNNYFYLIHKWGNDLHPFRKLMMWPLKNIWNLLFFILAISLIITLIIPIAIFTKTAELSSYLTLFFFMFKAIVSISLFYGFASGKNFNTAIWNNKFDKF
tara:strand:+ start:528 stop:1214 length:687 start_codon:yes stop_codon:yes gene_type:complete